MTFKDAQRRLLAYLRDRIHNGELTERGFAGMLGVSQPHVHNVLKGVRNVSNEISDSILNLLHISLLDLARVDELECSLKQRADVEGVVRLPFLDGFIGPRRSWPVGINWRDYFPAPFSREAASSELVMARIAWDPEMLSTLRGYDVAVLDTSEAQRMEPSPDGLYVVEIGGNAVIRFVRLSEDGYSVVSDATMVRPEAWMQINVAQSGLASLIKARVLWVGRERACDLPIAQRGRFLCEVISS